MGMKLLSPNASKDKQQDEVTRKILRIQEVEALLAQTNKALERAEVSFEAALARHRETWEQEEEGHRVIVKRMEKEIGTLERRKEQALIPISIYRKQADDLLLSAQDVVTRVTRKEEELDEIRETLEEKLTDLADREFLVTREAQRLTVERQGIEVQKQQVQDSSNELSRHMQEFYIYKEREERVMSERKRELDLAEIGFNAKQDKYLRNLGALKVWERQLKDERDTLKRAMERVNK